MYLVGDLTNYSEDDFHSDDIQAAYEQALTLSEDATENTFGIWTDEGDNLVAVAHNGEIFVKVQR